MRWLLPILGLLIAAYLFFNSQSSDTMDQIPSVAEESTSRNAEIENPRTAPKIKAVIKKAPLLTSERKSEQRANQKEKKKEPTVLHYRVDDGIATVLGDMAVGVLTNEDAEDTGLVELSSIRLWDSPNIPFIIDPNVANSAPILEALQMFNTRTDVRFLEYEGEADALVFTKTDGASKSYVGKVGGLQPVWIAPDANAATIAHEIMHALGFIHEQNRFDRDQFIQVQMDNIEDEFKHNFAILPGEFMKLTGLSRFDFESIMIYPPWMFAKGGKSTMEPKVANVIIHPSPALSRLDIQRINRIYGR